MASLRRSVPPVLLRRIPSERIIGYAERLASYGATLFLFVAASFAVVAREQTVSSLERARVATTLNQSFQRARYDVGAEESLERKYRLEPSRHIRDAHARAGADLEAALRVAISLDADDARRIATIVGQQRSYMAATQTMFAAVDAHRPDLATRIDNQRLDPVFDSVERDVFSRATAQNARQTKILDRLQRDHSATMSIAAALSFASLTCFTLYLWVLSTYKRRLSVSHQHEVELLANAAMVDHLTATGNHRAYKEHFARLVSSAAISGEPLALAIIDIDEMKTINDHNGHMQGDIVLQMVGRLLHSLRFDDQAFRVGGDEFAVILPRTSQGDACATMERLRRDVQRLVPGATVSVGVAEFDRGHRTGGPDDADTLQGRADAALYGAKRQGRNAVVGFDAGIEGQWLLAPAKVRALRDLIETGDMGVVFQPIWDLETQTILAYEALARPPASSGFAGPQELFDLAERLDRAHDLDVICYRAILARASVLPDDALLFINMTPATLDRGHLDPARFAADVAAAGLTPERVVIELTERSVSHIDAVVSVAAALRHLGFRIALDDTGAGNAGLEILSRLPVEFVKIDRSIILKALTDRNARGVMAGIVAIAREIGAYVIAEGIEDAAMLDFVCDRARESDGGRRTIHAVQGYLLLRPSDRAVSPQDARSTQVFLRGVAGRDDRVPRVAAAPERHATVARP
ncbi:MAG: hypothetical protein NVS2B8_13730 [Vulcanimicrobiaceae bacterium]